MRSTAACSKILDKVLTFKEFREDIKDHILNPNQYCGMQSRTIKSLNEITKGFRMGEFTVFTGHTGTGKTTVLSQLSLDYCTQGLPTMWGSFEIKPALLCKKMMLQFAQVLNADNFEIVADKFKDLPLFFLNFFGSTFLQDVIPAMETAVRNQGVKHIIIDNLQFMLSDQSRGLGDKYDLLDKSVSTLRAFATYFNVHVTVVVHPRKEQDDADLGIHSIYGSAKATQEADNVFILQRDKTEQDARYLDIKKNRFDGQLGRIRLGYDRGSQQVYEKPSED